MVSVSVSSHCLLCLRASSWAWGEHVMRVTLVPDGRSLCWTFTSAIHLLSTAIPRLQVDDVGRNSWIQHLVGSAWNRVLTCPPSFAQ